MYTRVPTPGPILIAVGLLLALFNLGIDLHRGRLFFTLWPLPLIVVGIWMVRKKKPPRF